MPADLADQALGKNADDGAGDEIGFNAKIQQPRNGTRRIVGVEGTEDEVPSQRALDGHDGGLAVADFAEHDDVGVLTKNAPQAAGEGHALTIGDLRLADAFEFVLDRVFNRENVPLTVVDLLERCIKCRALAKWELRKSDVLQCCSL
jgi:hypothetical protein